MCRKIILAALGIAAIASGSVGQTIKNIEPPHWWVGMQDTALQIMLYGENIGHLRAHTSYSGVHVITSECPDNRNYLFITLCIQKNTRSGTIPVYLADEGRIVQSFDYGLVARGVQSAQRPSFDSRDVIYLITPDRFANGDPDNDDIPGMKERHDRAFKNGRHGGDIEGIRQHLDYIADMGFTAIWPMPVQENDMPRYSYHGYAITDFYNIDRRFGTNGSFKAFTAEAAGKGIKMIMDVVVNHIGFEHPWMKDSPTQDWINYYGKSYVESNHRKTLPQDPYAAAEDLAVLHDGWFVRSMPDLNVRNPWLTRYLIQNTIWWIEYAGLSGIRMDTWPYPDKSFMSTWSKAVTDEYPYLNIVGEVWYDDPAIVSYWQKGKQNADGYVSYAPSLFDFPLQNALIKALIRPEGWDDGWLHLYEMLARDFQYADPSKLVVFAGNHDMIRLTAQLGNDVPKMKMALTFIATMRGIPQIFYGTEVLM